MVLWCKVCNAFIGVREPIKNWSIDRMSICPGCLEKQMDFQKHRSPNDTVEETALPAEDAAPPA
jgi:hypothetical protein